MTDERDRGLRSDDIVQQARDRTKNGSAQQKLDGIDEAADGSQSLDDAAQATLDDVRSPRSDDLMQRAREQAERDRRINKLASEPQKWDSVSGVWDKLWRIAGGITAVALILYGQGFLGGGLSEAETAHNDGVEMIGDDRFEDAVARFTEVIKLEPTDTSLVAETYLKRSIAFVELGRIEEALADDTAAIELEPSDIDILAGAHWFRAIDLNDLDRTDEAVLDLQKVVELLPASHELSQMATSILADLEFSLDNEPRQPLSAEEFFEMCMATAGYEVSEVRFHPGYGLQFSGPDVPLGNNETTNTCASAARFRFLSWRPFRSYDHYQ